MAFIIKSTNDIGVGDRILPASGDSIFILPGVLVAAEGAGGDGMQGWGFTDLFLSLQGTIYGDDNGAELGANSRVVVSSEGVAMGANAAILFMGANCSLSNDGTVSGELIGVDLRTGATGAHIVNTGTISALAGTGIAAGNDVTGVTIVNSGTLSGAVDAINFTGTAGGQVFNSGLISGNIVFGSGDDLMRNSGDMFGNVDLGSGNDSFASYLNGFVAGTVSGGTGNDTLIGGNAGDLLDGGADVDFMRGRAGDDTLLGGSENDRLYGEEGNDRLQGDAGNDAIFGGAGEDVIVGGNGLDVLFGGADADTFVYNSFADSEEGGLFDRIRDFTPGEDKINLSSVAAGIDFVANFTGTGPEVRALVTSAGLQLVQVDYNGDGAADMRIALLGTTELVTENDFIL